MSDLEKQQGKDEPMSKKNMKAKAPAKQETKLALAEYVQRFGRDMGTAEEAFGRMAK